MSADVREVTLLGVHLVPPGLLQLTAVRHQRPDYFDACSRCRTLPPAWSQAPVGVTTSHQCYGSCTGCQSVSASCSRSRGSYISRLLDWLPRTSQMTVAFCRTLAVAHCGPIPMTCGNCLCHEHITNSVIFAFYVLNVRHISTSGSFDLLT